jgi:type II/IV secretion system protein
MTISGGNPSKRATPSTSGHKPSKSTVSKISKSRESPSSRPFLSPCACSSRISFASKILGRSQLLTGAVTIRDLLKATLRHRPIRIVVGEIRGGEASTCCNC